MNSPLPTFSAALPLTNLSGSYRVTLHHWQHGIDGTHRPNVPSGCQVCETCRPTVDNDSSNPAFNMMDFALNVY